MSVAPPWPGGGGGTSQAPKLTAAEVGSRGEQQGAYSFPSPQTQSPKAANGEGILWGQIPIALGLVREGSVFKK